MCLILPTTLVVRIPVQQFIGYVCVCVCVCVCLCVRRISFEQNDLCDICHGDSSSCCLGGVRMTHARLEARQRHGRIKSRLEFETLK